MQPFGFIESAVLFGLLKHKAVGKVSLSAADFSLHGAAYDFVVAHLDKYKEYPVPALLVEKFSDINTEAIDVSLDYALDEFQKQRTYRRAVKAIQDEKELLKQNPQLAVNNIVEKLGRISQSLDDEIDVYDAGSTDRLTEYRGRKNERLTSNLSMLGIPTPFTSLNKTGIGWQPGELVALFARPTVGKTWICVKTVAVAAQHGKKILFVTTEMPTRQVSLRVDVVLGKMLGYNFSHNALRRGDGLDEAAYEKFLSECTSHRLLMCDHMREEALSLASIAGKVRKYGPDILVLDGIHLLAGDAEAKDKAVWEKMYNLFYGIKRLSLNYNIVTIVSTQANRKAADTFIPPQPKDVAFGDALIQASDVAFSMSMVEGQEKQRMVQLQKYRDGAPPIETMLMQWDVDCGDIHEISSEVTF